MLPRSHHAVTSDRDIIERDRYIQHLVERHPEFDRRTKPQHSLSKPTGPWLDYKARSPEQLKRALDERQKEREKEYGWTQKQLQQLRKEQKRLAEEQERLAKAKERWGSPSGILPKSDRRSRSPRDERHASTWKEAIDRSEDSEELVVTKTSLSSWQAPEYYLIRELVVHLVNDAVDKSEESRVLGDKEASDPRVKQAQRHAEIPTEPRRDERRSPELSAEDLFEQLLAELIYSTASEFVSCEKFVLFQMQNIVIGSAEAAVTNGNGRERDDPAYDLVTRTYHHMIRERQEKRADVWQHTQPMQVSEGVRTTGATAPLDPDTHQLNFLSLRIFDNVRGNIPAFRIYRQHETDCWNQFTIELTLLTLSKKVIGCTALDVSGNQQQIAVGTAKGDIITYSLMQDPPQAVRYIRNVSTLPDPIVSLSWSLDGNRIVTVNNSGMFQVWSTYPGGRLAKGAKELDLMNPSTKAVPPQLTLLLTMDDQESDFNFQSGPLAESGAQKETEFPTIANFHPSSTLLATQNSAVIGLQSGNILRCDASFDTLFDSEEVQDAATSVHLPKVSILLDNFLGQEIRGELFKGHRTALICMGFIQNFEDMVTVDTDGNICIWRYDRDKLTHFGWFEPHKKYSLFLAERVYEIDDSEDKIVHFSDKSASEMKKKKRSELAQIKEKWEKKRKAAEQAIRRTTYRGLFFRETDSKGNRVTTVCEPLHVGDKGSYFHGTVRELSTRKLLKYFSQKYRVIKSHCTRLIEVKFNSSGTELIFCLLFPPFFPKESHISFITVLLDPEVKVHETRIDIALNEHEYHRCLTDNVCHFAVSQVLDASKSSYLFVTLLGSLLIYSRNTGSLLVSSRETDEPYTTIGSTKELQRLNIRSHIRLAHCAGHIQAILFAEQEPALYIFHVTDRNPPEKRRLLFKAYKLWKGWPDGSVPVELTTQRRKYMLDRDNCRHVELYLHRLILQLVDRAVQRVDGEYTEKELAENMMRDRIAASEYLMAQRNREAQK